MNGRMTILAAAVAAAMMTMTVSLFAAEPQARSATKSEPICGYRMMSDHAQGSTAKVNPRKEGVSHV